MIGQGPIWLTFFHGHSNSTKIAPQTDQYSNEMIDQLFGFDTIAEVFTCSLSMKIKEKKGGVEKKKHVVDRGRLKGSKGRPK